VHSSAIQLFGPCYFPVFSPVSGLLFLACFPGLARVSGTFLHFSAPFYRDLQALFHPALRTERLKDCAYDAAGLTLAAHIQ
jgi:hypothetical protein